MSLFFGLSKDTFKEAVCACIRVYTVVGEHSATERDAIVKDSQTVIL